MQDSNLRMEKGAGEFHFPTNAYPPRPTAYGTA